LVDGEHRRVLEAELVLQARGRIAEARRGDDVVGRGGERVSGRERESAGSAAVDEQTDARWVNAALFHQSGTCSLREQVR
jgi:hypothetical protein